MKKIITWFIDNPVISNLLMLLIIIGGLLTTRSIKMEVFPSFELDVITISAIYPGASPTDIEKSVCIPIEESIYGLSGIKKIRSSSTEGYGHVMVELLDGEDVELVKEKIESAVDAISNFPKNMEEPIINQLIRTVQVLDVAISGYMDPESLDNLTNEIKDDLDAIDGINLTQIAIPKEKNILITLSRDNLIKHNISMEDLEHSIKMYSIELPGGKIENSHSQTVIRIKQKANVGKDIGNIEILSSETGQNVKIKDIADIKDAFKRDDIKLRFNNKPASAIMVFRVGKQNALEVAEKVDEYIKLKSQELPDGLEIEAWNDESKYLKGRLNLLLKNAFIGLGLVMLILSFFLKPKLAFWVSLGIPISFLGALWFFPVLDVSINMLSLFTFILVLGIVVDDAIVVGENFYRYKQKGEDPRSAAIKGAYEVSKPVIFAVLTTMATFSPMLFVEGASGKIWKIFPLVVIPILSFSLFESLAILPFHLAHSKNKKSRIIIINKISLFWDKIRRKVNHLLKIIIDEYYSPFLKKCLKNNWTTLSVFFSIFILTIGIIYSGYIKFNFFPGLESDIIFAQVQFPKGTTIEETEKGVKILEDSLKEVELEYDKKNDANQGSILNIFTIIGAQPMKSATTDRGSAAGDNSFTGDNLAEIAVELSPGENRNIKSGEIANRWRELTPNIPGIKDLKFTSSLFSAGEDINFQFNSKDIIALNNVVDDFKNILNSYPGVYDIIDNNNKGNSELVIKMLPNAKYYGLDMYSVSNQIRDAFHGKKIMSVQRGRDEVDVIIQYSEEDRGSLLDLEKLIIKTPKGSFISIKSVCSIEAKKGYSSISRTDRKRSLSVVASVDEAISNSNDIISSIKKNDLKDLLSKYPNVTYSLEGQQKEQEQTLSSLTGNYLFALLIVFLLLAIPFKSYSQPLIVMSAIPYGIIGAVIGHLLLGMDFSILSMLGIAALSGVVVNDSLVMMDYINRNKELSKDPIKAALNAGPIRFRPIFLTSITTFMGVLPLIFEKSIQAKFLVPMAVSLGFGVLFSTFVTLILVPTTYITFEKIKEYFRKISIN